MSKTPPERIDPAIAAEKGRSFEGSFPIARMQRLSGMLIERFGEVRFELHFGREGGFGTVRGSVTAELMLECQCCLASMKLPVRGEFALGVVSSLEQGNALPDSFEPLIVGEEGDISIIELIEDELLLSVPHVPQHPVCPRYDTSAVTENSTASTERKAFADLSSIIKSNKTVG